MVSTDGNRWNLTPKALEALLDRLADDRLQAAAEYESLRQRLLDFFRWKGAPEPEVRADDTFDRVARKLREGEKVSDVRRYSFGVARMVLLESRRDHQRQRDAADQWQPAAEEPIDDERVFCLDRCLQALPPDVRSLLISYYQAEGSPAEERRALAARLGITVGALKVRAYRARAQLESCLRECLGASRNPSST
jgi:DNA-directed RNA polymerase specialized sigma24 family protein